ncbi:MAG: flavin reductase [Alphaproteobacteria bacterium]|nr:MAG: flavin reductase [Alphaproteobacteria bacterium]
MFYETARRDHGLPHDPFKAIVAPRPIGWISTVSADGRFNLAPYSFFNAVSSRPELVMFSSEGEKDSVTNIRATGEFVANYVSADMARLMNATSVDAPSGVSEFDYAGLKTEKSILVAPPRVAGILAALECRATQIFALTDLDGKPAGATMVVGQVVGVHIDERALRNGRFDPRIAHPVTRLGYRDFGGPDGYFEMIRPVWGGQSSTGT